MGCFRPTRFRESRSRSRLGYPETRCILRIDCRSGGFTVRRDTMSVQRQQRPILAHQDLQAQRVPADGGIHVADGEVVRIAFVGIRDPRAAQKIDLIPHRDMRVGIHVSLNEQGELSLTRRKTRFRSVGRRGIGIGQAAEGTADVGRFGP